MADRGAILRAAARRDRSRGAVHHDFIAAQRHGAHLISNTGYRQMRPRSEFCAISQRRADARAHPVHLDLDTLDLIVIPQNSSRLGVGARSSSGCRASADGFASASDRLLPKICGRDEAGRLTSADATPDQPRQRGSRRRACSGDRYAPACREVRCTIGFGFCLVIQLSVSRIAEKRQRHRFSVDQILGNRHAFHHR